MKAKLRGNDSEVWPLRGGFGGTASGPIVSVWPHRDGMSFGEYAVDLRDGYLRDPHGRLTKLHVRDEPEFERARERRGVRGKLQDPWAVKAPPPPRKRRKKEDPRQLDLWGTG